jgi:hypothetical protein
VGHEEGDLLADEVLVFELEAGWFVLFVHGG